MQRASKRLQVVDGQGELPLIRIRKSEPVAVEVVRACRDMVAAFNLAVNVSGLDEKEIYTDLDIDPSHWSRMRKGESHFPLNKLNDFSDIVGNEILLEYWAWTRGKGLHILETEAERRIRELEHENETLKRDKKVLVDAFHGKALG